MAANLPDAKIVVRLDTQGALRDLEKLRKQGATTASESGRPASAAKPKPQPVPSSRMSSDDEAGERTSGGASAVQSAKKIVRATKKVERSISKLDRYAGAAVAGVAASLVIAERVDPTGAIKKVLEETLDGLLRGSAAIAEINARIQSLQEAIQAVKDTAIALQLGGDQADPATLREAGVLAYEWAAVQQRRRAFADRQTRRATGAAIGDLISSAFSGGR